MTITIKTSRFGDIGIDEAKVISFPNGLLGFPELKRFVLMDYKDTPIKWLQAVDDPDVAFIVTDPGTFNPDLNLQFEGMARTQLKLESDDDLAVLLIVRVEGEQIIANLEGPLAINSRLMLGYQAVNDRLS